MNAPPTDPSKRAAARRTVWVLGVVALVIYAGFIVAGVLGVAGGSSP